MARLHRLGNDSLDGCTVLQELDLEAAGLASTDAFVEAAALPDDDVGIPESMLLAAARTAVSSVGRDLTLANRLRVAGLEVVEIQGWRTRGDAVLSWKADVSHHTAGPAAGVAPSLGICINGRPDLRGPLCNDFLGRDLVARVIASGRANHAGSGGWRGAVGNSQALGTECEHVGTTKMPQKMVPVLVRMKAAHLMGSGVAAAMCCQHREWSTAGKIDIATDFDTTPEADQFRRWVAEELRRLADVTKSRITYPTPTWKPTTRHPRGQWVRKSVVVATENVEEWIEKRPAIKERRGAGSGITITPVAA